MVTPLKKNVASAIYLRMAMKSGGIKEDLNIKRAQKGNPKLSPLTTAARLDTNGPWNGARYLLDTYELVRRSMRSYYSK